MELLDKLQKFKNDSDMSYKNIAIECQIPFSTFYNFTSGLRKMKPKYEESLTKFLEEKGY